MSSMLEFAPPLNGCIAATASGKWPTVVESPQRAVARKVSEAVGFIVGVTGNLVYINLIGRYAGNNLALKTTLLFANNVGFGGITGEILRNYMKALFTKNEETVQFIMDEGGIGKTRRYAYYFFSVSFGAVATIPFATMAHVYNDKLPMVYRDLMFAFIMISNSSISIKSTEKTFFGLDRIVQRKFYSEIEKELDGVKQNLIKALGIMKMVFAEKTNGDREAFLTKLSGADELQQVVVFLEEIATLLESAEKAPVQQGGAIRKVVTAASIVFATGMLTHYVKLGELFSKLINGELDDDSDSSVENTSTNTASHVGWSTFVGGCNTWLTYDLIYKSSHAIYSRIEGLFWKKRPESVLDTLRSKTLIAIDLFAATIGGLCFAGAVQFTKDYMPDDEYGEAVKYTAPEGVSLFITAGLMLQLKHYLRVYVSQKGSQDEQKAVEFEHSVNRLIDLIDNCSSVELARAMLEWNAAMPPDLWTKLGLPKIEGIRGYFDEQISRMSVSLVKHEHQNPSPSRKKHVSINASPGTP